MKFNSNNPYVLQDESKKTINLCTNSNKNKRMIIFTSLCPYPKLFTMAAL